MCTAPYQSGRPQHGSGRCYSEALRALGMVYRGWVPTSTGVRRLSPFLWNWCVKLASLHTHTHTHTHTQHTHTHTHTLSLSLSLCKAGKNPGFFQTNQSGFKPV